uniref:Prefoldin subunit 2 n=1 Tax=Chrysemys picta bellii TaxID=8478 RepID=A0A8C3H9Z2_CHRPI
MRRTGGKMADSGKSKSAPTAPSTGKALTAEQVVAGFNRLRQEQRGLASKAAELELELNEHSLVIDTLREVDPTRKCYRMVGGVLVERTVKEVLPALESNKEQVMRVQGTTRIWGGHCPQRRPHRLSSGIPLRSEPHWYDCTLFLLVMEHLLHLAGGAMM